MFPGSQSLGPFSRLDRRTIRDNKGTSYSSPKCNTSGPSDDADWEPAIRDGTSHLRGSERKNLCCVEQMESHTFYLSTDYFRHAQSILKGHLIKCQIFLVGETD